MQFPWFAPPKKVKIGKNSDFSINLLIFCWVLGVQTMEIALNKKKSYLLYLHMDCVKKTLHDQFSRIVEINQSKINLKNKILWAEYLSDFQKVGT